MTKLQLTEKCYSVCIGINRYASSLLPQLRCAENDARAMDTLLGRLGFPPENRLLLIDEAATLEAVNAALSDIILDRPQQNDLVLFYFAGHSKPLMLNEQPASNNAEAKYEVFLATYDFDPQQIKQSRSFRKHRALGMERLRKDFFEGEGARKRLFIFDSCYSGDFFGPRYRDDIDPVQGYIERILGSTSVGRVALLSCLPLQKAVENPDLHHGLFTYFLLEALAGEAPAALRHDGWLTVGSLFEYIAEQLPEDQRPVLSGVQHDSFRLVRYPKPVTTKSRAKKILQQNTQSERERRLKALLADHSSFIQDRLNSFVGRLQELAEIRQRISEKTYTGGYVTITGQAGQGKSSIIARLVDEYKLENVVHHFIPFNPGPDYQVGLLRNLMARLILKYNLSDLYVASENRAALREYFPKVLTEIAEKRGQEVIFIDGLDQLKEDENGERDLSFLPDNPPVGIVFVLGTRPNDTLRPLKLLKPYNEYQLPDLSRQDFELILKHRHVHLDTNLADQFYTVMQKNALYLDLVARELAESESHGMIPPAEIIKRIAHDPDSIFSLAMARFRRHPRQWRTVIKPILGILLVTLEPLTIRHIRQISNVEDDELREGLERLGGLIAKDGQQYCSLFHLKLHDYLREDEKHSDKDYIFAVDEEQGWHKKLAEWCEGDDLNLIWQDVKTSSVEQGRREYARRHYVTHLYQAREWAKLFAVLDSETYGQAKMRFDPGMRSYVQELNLGRQAAACSEETLELGLHHLSQLWRYTLLRCSLSSRADRYSKAAFEALLALGRETEAVGLAELLTRQGHKARVLILIAKYLKIQPGRTQEALQFLMRACEIARSLGEQQHIELMVDVSYELAKMQLWKHAEEVACSIESSQRCSFALRNLVLELVEAQQWKFAEEIAANIKEQEERIMALSSLGIALVEAHHWDHAETIAHSIEAFDERQVVLSKLGHELMKAHEWKKAEAISRSLKTVDAQSWMLTDLGIELARAQEWDLAETVIRSIENSEIQARALSGLNFELIEMEQWDLAEKIAYSHEKQEEQIMALSELASTFIEKQMWMRAETLTSSIERNEERDRVLVALATALIEVQSWEQAKNAIALIHQVELRVQIEKTLVLALVGECEWELAEALVPFIENPLVQADVMSQLALALAKAELWEQARKITFAIHESSIKLHLLYVLVSEFSQRQQWNRAEDLWSKAEVLEKQVKGPVRKTERELCITSLCELGVALTTAGEEKRAEKIWEQARRWSYLLDDEERKARFSISLVAALARARQLNRAIDIKSEIEEKYERIDLEKWVGALCELWVGLTEAQKEDEANNLWVELIDLVDEGMEGDISILCDIGIALVRVQKRDHAEEIWQEIQDDYLDSGEYDISTEQLLKFLISLVEVQAWLQAKNVIETITRYILNIDHRHYIELIDEINELMDIYRIKSKNNMNRNIDSFITYMQNKIEVACEIREELKKIENKLDEVLMSRDYVNRTYNLCELYCLFFDYKYCRENIIDENDEKEEELIVELKESIQKVEDYGVRFKVEHEIRDRLWKVNKKLAEEIYSNVLYSIEAHEERAWVLLEYGNQLIKDEKWGQIEEILLDTEIIAQSIEEREKRAEVFYALTLAFVEAGYQEHAERVWQEARETTHAALPFEEGAKSLIILGAVFNKESMSEQAERVWKEVEKGARIIKQRVEGTQILLELCITLAQAHYWDWMRDIWNSIRGVFVTTEVWEEESEIEEEEIEKKAQLMQTLIILSEILIQYLQWDLCSEVAGFIADPSAKAEILQLLGLALCRAGQWKQAKRLWEKERKESVWVDENQEDILMGGEPKRLSDWSVQWELENVRAPTIWEQQARITVLMEIGTQLYKAQQSQYALEVWREAKTLIHMERETKTRNLLKRKLAIGLAQCQQLYWSTEIANTITAIKEKCAVFLVLGFQYYKAGNEDFAKQFWNKAKINIYTKLNDQIKAEALQKLGMMLSLVGERQQAEEIWNDVERIIEKLPDVQQRDRVTAMFAHTLAKIQQWKRVEKAISRMEASKNKAEALIDLGILLAQAELWQPAERVWKEARRQAFTVKEPGVRAAILIKLAAVLAQNEHIMQAKLICMEVILLGQENAQCKEEINASSEFLNLLEIVGAYEQLLHLVQDAWLQADTRTKAMRSLALGFKLLHLKPEIGIAFYESFAWVDRLLRG